MAQALVSYFWKRPTGYPCAPWGQCGARGRHVGDRIFSTIQALKLVSLSDIKFGIHVCHESTHKKPDLKRHGKSAILLWMDFFEGLFCHKRAHLLRENCAAEIIWGGGGGKKRWEKKKENSSTAGSFFTEQSHLQSKKNKKTQTNNVLPSAALTQHEADAVTQGRKNTFKVNVQSAKHLKMALLQVA